jgi:hypothetical protein
VFLAQLRSDFFRQYRALDADALRLCFRGRSLCVGGRVSRRGGESSKVSQPITQLKTASAAIHPDEIILDGRCCLPYNSAGRYPEWKGVALTKAVSGSAPPCSTVQYRGPDFCVLQVGSNGMQEFQ